MDERRRKGLDKMKEVYGWEMPNLPGDYFALTVEPPQTHTPEQVRPRELVFVVDTSTSMLAEPLETAVDVIRRALVTLAPGDTFQVVRLTAGRPALAPAPLRNTTANVARAVAYLTGLGLDDGPESLAGVSAALARRARARASASGIV